MQLNSQNVGKRAPEWEAQLEYIRLPRDLMGGTAAMRRARERYLPRKVEEGDEEYTSRLKQSFLLNEFKRTVVFSSGQVFQKQVRYQEQSRGENGETARAPYDEAFFAAFQENVDTQGTNLSMFAEKVFTSGVVDGVCFNLTEYPSINQKTENGVTLYQADGGEWRPRTAMVDLENGWNPYWVIIRADQVLDAWLDTVNGRSVLRAFRYVESVMREDENGNRVLVERVRAIFPDHWELWESEQGSGYVQVASGENSLGFVPVTWFMPGEQRGGLSAQSALDDLAWMNLDHWQAYSAHKELMQYGRSPVWFGRNLGVDDDVPLVVGSGRFITSENDGADLVCRGVDASSIEKSFQDLQRIEERMSLYGLQLISQATTGGITATQASIAAASADSSLGKWVQLLQDCMENALRNVAAWRGESDGPGLFVNSEFRLPYDASAVQQESSQVRDGLSPLFVLYELKKKMGLVNEDMTFEKYIALIEEDRRRNETATGETPLFESFAGGGRQ